MTTLIENANFDAVPAGAPEVSRSTVDLAVLTRYETIQLDGEPDLIVELIDLYLEDAPRRMAGLQTSLSNRNWLSIKREAHGLRGSSASLGAHQMALICEEIERTDSGDIFPTIAPLVRSLEQELERVVLIFHAERRRRSQ